MVSDRGEAVRFRVQGLDQVLDQIRYQIRLGIRYIRDTIWRVIAKRMRVKVLGMRKGIDWVLIRGFAQGVDQGLKGKEHTLESDRRELSKKREERHIKQVYR